MHIHTHTRDFHLSPALRTVRYYRCLVFNGPSRITVTPKSWRQFAQHFYRRRRKTMGGREGGSRIKPKQFPHTTATARRTAGATRLLSAVPLPTGPPARQVVTIFVRALMAVFVLFALPVPFSYHRRCALTTAQSKKRLSEFAGGIT